MMMNKTIEELEKELHNAKSLLSYHKNKSKGRSKSKGQSPKAREYALAQQIVWNDDKRAMAHVIAKLTTTNDKDYTRTRNQAYRMPIEEVRSLTKGYEKEIAEDIRQRQEIRKAKAKAKDNKQDITKMLDEWSSPDTPAPVKKTIPKSYTKNYGDSKETPVETHIAVPIKTTTLRLAKEVVSAMTKFEGLSNEQVVGHILCRYLQYNKEGKV